MVPTWDYGTWLTACGVLAGLEEAMESDAQMIAKWELENRYTYHPPTEAKKEKYEIIRSIAFAYATQLNELCPDGREKALALTKLDEVVFWANAAIAREVSK